MKVTARKEVRDKLHTLMTEGLGCQSKPATEQMQLYLLEDGFNIGIYYTDAADAPLRRRRTQGAVVGVLGGRRGRQRRGV